MAVINEDSPAHGQSSASFWQDELENTRILLYSVDKAIYALLSTGITEYTIDTGQDRQTVKRADIDMLQSRRRYLLSQIAVLEARLGIDGPRSVQVVPL